MKTWLFYLNYLILQWFFIRLARKIDKNTGNQIGWTVLKFVVPMSGWNTDYKFI